MEDDNSVSIATIKQIEKKRNDVMDDNSVSILR